MSGPDDARRLVLACLEKKHRVNAPSSLGDSKRLSDTEQRKNILDRIDQIRHLVAEGRIDDFVFVGRDVETKHFLTEVALSPVNSSEIFAFVGVLSALKLELTERSQLAPAMLLDGSYTEKTEKERLS